MIYWMKYPDYFQPKSWSLWFSQAHWW